MSETTFRILVCVRPFSADETDGVSEWGFNQLDRAGLAAATALASRHPGGEVVAISLGEEACEPTLRRFLAAGADRVVRIATDQSTFPDGIVLGRLLAQAVERLGADVVLAGVRSETGWHGRTGYELAANLGWPLSADAIGLAPAPDGNMLRLTEWAERGDRTIVDLPLPAVVLVREGVARPGYLAVAREKRYSSAKVEVLDLGDVEPVLRSVEADFGEIEVTIIAPKIRVKKKARTTSPDKPKSAADRRKALGGRRPRPASRPMPSAVPDGGGEPDDFASMAKKITDLLVDKELL